MNQTLAWKQPHTSDDVDKIVSDIVARGRRRKVQQILLGLGLPIVLLAIWEACCWAGLVDVRFFPPPSKIMTAMVQLLLNPAEAQRLGIDILATLQRISIGYTLGAVSGTLVGAFMGFYAPFRFALAPLIYTTFPTPKIAILPLMMVIFGIGDGSKVALVALGVFYMCCINTLSGVLYANPIFDDVSRAFRIPFWTRLTRFILPSALPAIVVGLKLGLGQALILVVSSEFVSSNSGIGRFIWDAWQVLDISRMFLGLVVTCLIGALAVLLGDVLERRLIPWASR